MTLTSTPVGMTGRDGTALRSLAAVAQASAVLSGADYVGDLDYFMQGSCYLRSAESCVAQTGNHWRVFNTSHAGLVAVLSSGLPSADNPLAAIETWWLPVRRAEGIDGSPASIALVVKAIQTPLGIFRYCSPHK